MKPYFFISDSHIGFDKPAEEKEKIERLLAFFRFVKENGERLFLLGDLYDFWFEYKTVIPRRNVAILLALKDLVDSGVKIDYLIGNHDFWVGDFFENDLGIQIHQEPMEIRLQDKKCFIAHGDGFARNDAGYRRLKKVLRHPLNIKLYRMIHPDIGFAVADFFSRWSRNSRDIKNKENQYLEYARERFSDGFDCVILAHIHIPQELKQNGKRYINTGDWMHHFTYGKLENGKLSLEYWTKNK